MTIAYDSIDALGSDFSVTLLRKEKSIIVLPHGVAVKIRNLQIGENSKFLCLRLKMQVKRYG